jgi:hypothetical protein
LIWIDGQTCLMQYCQSLWIVISVMSDIEQSISGMAGENTK